MELRDLGFNEWFEAHSDDMSQDGCGFARVAAVDGGRISSGTSIVRFRWNSRASSPAWLGFVSEALAKSGEALYK